MPMDVVRFLTRIPRSFVVYTNNVSYYSLDTCH